MRSKSIFGLTLATLAMALLSACTSKPPTYTPADTDIRAKIINPLQQYFEQTVTPAFVSTNQFCIHRHMHEEWPQHPSLAPDNSKLELEHYEISESDLTAIYRLNGSTLSWTINMHYVMDMSADKCIAGIDIGNILEPGIVRLNMRISIDESALDLAGTGQTPGSPVTSLKGTPVIPDNLQGTEHPADMATKNIVPGMVMGIALCLLFDIEPNHCNMTGYSPKNTSEPASHDNMSEKLKTKLQGLF